MRSSNGHALFIRVLVSMPCFAGRFEIEFFFFSVKYFPIKYNSRNLMIISIIIEWVSTVHYCKNFKMQGGLKKESISFQKFKTPFT